jgi:DNA-binding CsgD family transcriptional regulator
VRTDFVGRDRELAVLAGAFADACAGRPRLVLCRGEPGIGKTRLAEEFASRAEGAAVAWGTGTEDAGAPPYWPWREILRGLSRTTPLHAAAAELGVVPDLARLAPELFPDAPAPPSAGEAGEERFRLFDAVARLLGALPCPVVIVLDDAQWADDGTLLLLRHVAHGLDRQRLLLLVNHRDAGAVLASGPRTHTLEIRGLPAPDVARWLSALVGREVAAEDAALVHARTGGNPFFVGELALCDPGGPVPSSVRAAIGARLARLTTATVAVLRAAAIVGRQFRVAVVAAVVDVPVMECLAALDEASAAGLVEPLDLPGEHRFVHDLVRDAVEAGLATPDRVRLHRGAAAAVEAAAGGRVEPWLADLARHWAVAAVAGERAQAARWIRCAADEAVRGLAYEEAARLYRLALAVAAGELDDAERCRILLTIANALRQAEEVTGRVAACWEAAALARRLGLPELLAEAAVTLECGYGDFAHELQVRELCEEALAALEPAPTPLRARVAANLSDVCMYVADPEAAAAASAEALATAERCADPPALMAALRARQLVRSGPDGVAERARLAEELLALGRATGAPGARMWAHLWRIDVAFQRGDLATVASELGSLAVCAEQVRGPVARWHLLQAGAVLAQAQGRFADARWLADEAVAALPPTANGHASAVINRAALLSVVELHTGESEDLQGLEAGGYPDAAPDGTSTAGVIFAVAAAYNLVARGQLEQARYTYRRLGPPAHWRPIPHTTTVCHAFGIGTAVALDLPDDVAVLRQLLGRFRGDHVASGAGCVAYNGPAELYLGVAARYLGVLDEAVADLEAAARACAANGAAGFHVESRTELAVALARRAGPGDVARAHALAADVAKEAAALGMAPWVERADRLVTRLAAVLGDPLTPREREVAALVAEGLTNREIAARLYLSERTAQNHVQHILTKLGLPNRGQVAVWLTRRSADVSSGSE